MTAPTTAVPSRDPETSPAGARTPSSSRRRAWRRVLAGVVLLGLLALTAVLPEPRTTHEPLAPDSTADHGSRAVAQILQRQGVRVHHATLLDDAVAQAAPGTTLLVTRHEVLEDEHAARLAATGADLVLLEPGYLVGSYTSHITDVWEWGNTYAERPAGCAEPAAVAAGHLTWSGHGYAAAPGAVAVECFSADDGSGMVVADDGGRRIVALATSTPLQNGSLADDGNAALALHLLGRHHDLVWYTPTTDEVRNVQTARGVGIGDLVPPWLGFVAIQLLVLAAVVALWRGRRLGPLAAEPLPVVVRSAETARGRGRLYRRSRSYGRAGAALRAAAASRSAQRLGLPRSADAQAVIDAVARASGRPESDVAQLLYGPPPTSDHGLTHLARELDRLESEVNRP